MPQVIKDLSQFGCLLFILFLSLVSCATQADRNSGKATRYVDPGKQSDLSGIGIESQDIIRVTDKMIHDILANPKFSQPAEPPKVVIDAKYFKNEGASRINKNLITDRLRTELNRAAHGKMQFISREHLKMLINELELKQSGIIDEGKSDSRSKISPADYRLGGRIATLDSINPQNGSFSRYHQILFEMIDLDTGRISWSGLYNFKKTAQEDIIYR